MAEENDELVCCGERLEWLIADSPSGRRHARTVGKGIPVRLWRCRQCEQVTHEGWVPPTWINAVAREAAKIQAEIDAQIRLAYMQSAS